MLHKLSLGQKILYYSLLVVLAIVILFPIYYMFTISLKLPKDIYRSPSLLPINATLRNYIELFTKIENFLIENPLSIRIMMGTSERYFFLLLATICRIIFSTLSP